VILLFYLGLHLQYELSNEVNKMVKCKKIVFERLSGKTPVVVLGVILEEGKHRCKFRTSKKEYSIAWSKIWSIEDTEEDFKL